MGKNTLWKDILILAGTVLAVVGLLFLPSMAVLVWKGETIFQIGKVWGILIGYVLLLAGLWLPELLSVQGKRKRLLSVLGVISACGGLALLTGFLLVNLLSPDGVILYLGVLLLWPMLHGAAQYFLCRKAKNIAVRCIPVYVCVLELLYTGYVYYDFWDLFGGWDELAAVYVGMVTVPPAGAVLLAWLLWWSGTVIRRRKQGTE